MNHVSKKKEWKPILITNYQEKNITFTAVP